MLLICSVVGLLGLVSAAAGLGAEATRVKVSTYFLSFYLFSSHLSSWPC